MVVEHGTNLHVLDAASGSDLWHFEAAKTVDKGPQDNSNNCVYSCNHITKATHHIVFQVALNDTRYRSNSDSSFQEICFGNHEVDMLKATAVNDRKKYFEHRSAQIRLVLIDAAIDPLSGRAPRQAIEVAYHRQVLVQVARHRVRARSGPRKR